jgi:hypothetical protein
MAGEEVTQVITTVIETINPEIPQSAARQMKALAGEIRGMLRGQYMGQSQTMAGSYTGGIVPLKMDIGLKNEQVKQEASSRRGRRSFGRRMQLTPDESLDYRKEWMRKNTQPFMIKEDFGRSREGSAIWKQTKQLIAEKQAYATRNSQLIAENKQLTFRVKQLEGNLRNLAYLKKQQEQYKEWFKQQGKAYKIQYENYVVAQGNGPTIEGKLQWRGRIAR